MKINVTKSYLPNKEQYFKRLDTLWETRWLTNNGDFVIELEENLKKRLGVKHLFYVGNGTIALQIALKTINCEGSEVITTPFSYVATTSSIVWEGFTPVFADIKKDSWNIDPMEIEKKVTKKSKAILATHVFGNSCEYEKIDTLAKKHKLFTIYDSAHAFDVSCNGIKIANFGDISTFSFHATKMFHTIEGGAIATNNDDLAFRISYLRNFGHNGPLSFHGIGINGKNSEFHAAMGLCNLENFDLIKQNYRELYENYVSFLNKDFYTLQSITDIKGYNFSYFPILFRTENELLDKMKALIENNIYPRRYFYPSLNKLPYLEPNSLPIAENISSRILCLPMYYELTQSDQMKIIDILNFR
jgi:dTDP-4-amino-4,6-dideoxygalactose transaminase